jgi:exosortase A-associated hydrolase 2
VNTPPGAPFEPFYLKAAIGERFCIYHPAGGTRRGALVYVHPFAEEMNKARRVAAAQSRMLAARGYAVLQIDLYGCGDSSGDFGDARWEIWKDDVRRAVQWLMRRTGSDAVHLWGLRLGALLSMDYGVSAEDAPAGYVLWEPVLSGEAFLSQFLRLRVARELVSGAGTATTRNLREQLERGAALEIAGYVLAPQLARAMAGLDLAVLRPRAAPAYWVNIVPGPDASLPPAARRVVDAWRADGALVEARAVAGEPFWSSVEFVDSPRLLAHTVRLFQRVPA